jgi:hypothetical protein
MRELKLAIESHFEHAYDASAGDWTIAIHARPFSSYYVACAVPRKVIETARAAFSETGQCDSIRPFLVSEVNRRAKRLPRHCWYLASARDYVAIGHIVMGECRGIRVVPVSAETQRLAEVVEQQRLLAGDDEDAAPVMLSGVGQDHIDEANLQRLDCGEWHAKGQTWSSIYRLALSEMWV